MKPLGQIKGERNKQDTYKTIARKDETQGRPKQTACGKNRGQRRTDAKILKQKL